ncbi:MAG: LacI family DNA-binding transcriptional regulator [Azospirillaceae bacterium]|nr:LacI family DNA-binding transcriptional regulator [Azospirillaceae bacterium]
MTPGRKTPSKSKAAAAPSLADVARLANVSISTASRIVNGELGRASAETVARVRRAIEEVRYHPNHIGRSLRRRESRIVAMLIANLDNPAMAAIMASTEAALRADGYVMFLCDTHDRADLQDEYLYAMRSQGVEGYVMVTSVPSPGLKEFVEDGVPMVFVSRRNPCGPGAFVGIDNVAAGADAADHFWFQGITELAVLYPEPNSSATQERVSGFCRRLETRGVPPERIIHAAAPGLFHMQVGYDAAQGLAARTRWPRGILCVSDQIAYGAYRFTQECKIPVPAACALVSIDGSPLNAWLAPWLTSVFVPYGDFGRQIVELLISIWGDDAPSDRILPHRIESSGGPGIPSRVQEPDGA